MEISTQQTSIVLDSSWAAGRERTLPAPVAIRRERHYGDRVFATILKIAASLVIVLLALIALFLFVEAIPAIKKFGVRFPFTSQWDPVQEVFGALPVIFGTVVSSVLAMCIATPLSVGIALFLNEEASLRVARPVGFLVEMLAAIPSVVYGLWGIFVLAPWLRETVEPFLAKTLGFLPLFQGAPYGVGMMSAGVILAIMVIPTVSSISKEVFRAIPRSQREAALALGATRTEMMWLAVIQTARPGIFGAVILGLGRAIGETMAVTMVIGNRAEISASLFAPGQTMASVIANEYAEATSNMHLSALAGIGLALFAVTFVMNGSARFIVWRFTRRVTK